MRASRRYKTEFFFSLFYRVRSFSTGPLSDPVSSDNNVRDENKIDPYWITGFCDRSACFSITVALRATGRWESGIYNPSECSS
jgi:hypothetical protein